MPSSFNPMNLTKLEESLIEEFRARRTFTKVVHSLKGVYEETFVLVDEDWLKSALSRYKEGVVGIVAEIGKKDHDKNCQYDTPRGMTANAYDCTDIHIGYKEAVSDIIKALR